MQRALVVERTLMFMKMDSPEAQELVKAHPALLTAVMEHWKAYTSFQAADAERKVWAEFAAARDAWMAVSREVMKLLVQDNREARRDAIDVSQNEGAEKFERARKVLDRLTEVRVAQAAAYARAEESRASQMRWWMIAGAAGAVALALGLSLGLSRSISRPLGDTLELLKDIAEGEGDLTKRLRIRTRDEIGELSGWFNTFVDKLSDIIARMRGASNHVAGASRQLSAASGQLASGTQQQAASLEETAASLEEITATVKQNAENARQASQLAGGSRDAAERGGQVVASAVASMQEITQSSRRIADIITVIDEIAFQTNLLALNAAVEAARAGDQGRGFAVVAAEVRNLAQRSAGAAKEIKALIQESVAKVAEGSEHVNKSGKTLEEIVLSAKRVADIVEEIAAACHEQSSGIDQVNRAVAQMDKVTQDNATQTEELSSTAQSLAHQAEEMLSLVSRFTLSEGQGAMPAAAPMAMDDRPAAPSAVERRKRPRGPAVKSGELVETKGGNGHGTGHGHGNGHHLDFEEF
jgi:methyl-accepting chemotaxis protein